MTTFEYKVLPAPAKGLKIKGARTTEARFAEALMQVMNEMGREGWEYQRADTLPCEERVGLTGRTTKFQNMLVFRRALRAEAAAGVEPQRMALPMLRPVPEPAAALPAEAAEPAARRIAATLSTQLNEGSTPTLRAVPDVSEAPRLGGARGQGLPHPGRTGGDPGVAAE